MNQVKKKQLAHWQRNNSCYLELAEVKRRFMDVKSRKILRIKLYCPRPYFIPFSRNPPLPPLPPPLPLSSPRSDAQTCTRALRRAGRESPWGICRTDFGRLSSCKCLCKAGISNPGPTEHRLHSRRTCWSEVLFVC